MINKSVIVRVARNNTTDTGDPKKTYVEYYERGLKYAKRAVEETALNKARTLKEVH